VYATRHQLPLKVRQLLEFLVEAPRTPPWDDARTEGL